MKKLNVIIVIAFMAIASTSFAQNTEVLFFKAKLSCCQAKACNELEGNIKTIVEKHFANNEVAFRTINLADADNKTLAEKFNAKSQTVVIVKSDKSLDITDQIASYQGAKDKDAIEQKIVNKIKSFL
ncbi:MAG: hypothetical protein PF489_14350 [Salinivirgaceae bacterium]|jgi:hypothetical protein|nr:hypothetical protein [Salinivirgaceae bacterium]